MAKHTKKSTRKFEKNHLKDTIERRKASAKFKQRNQVKAKRQARNTKDAEFLGHGQEADEDEDNGSKPKSKKDDAFSKMTVDEFFQGGFDIPESSNKRQKKVSTTEKLGKRKRASTEDAAEETTCADDSADTSMDDAPMIEDDESNPDAADVGMNKDAMDALAEKDPEFYKYLQENDPETLDFDEESGFPEMDEISASETDEKPAKKAKKAQEAPATENGSEVTAAMVSKWAKAMSEQQSLRAMREMVLAFRAAAHVNEDEGTEYKYTISSPEVYHELLVCTLQQVPMVLGHHLPVKESASGRVRVPTEQKKFRTLTPLLKSHVSSVQHLLTTLSDAPTLKITLAALMPLLPYLLSFRKMLKTVVKTLVDIWSDTASTEATRITAFLAIRRLAVIGDAGIREAVLKTVYQGLVKGSRNTTVHTMPGINLMKNSAAELWGLDQALGYTTGFTFVRQLAIHLRGSITNKAKESHKSVYNWQYVHSLDFWSCVLSEHCSALREAERGAEAQLRPLIYPTVQVTLGALRLVPTATYFPLRFQLVRSLLRLSRATGTYIPLASALLEVLSAGEMKKPPRPSTLRPLDFASSYKAPKSYLRTRVYQDGVGEQACELLADFFALWATSVALPELALPVVVMLKRWLKEVGGPGKGTGTGRGRSSGNKNSKVNNAVVLLVQKLQANSRWIEEKRAKVDFAPNNRAGVEGFLKGFEWEKTPLGAFVVGQRRQRDERARMLEEGRRDDEEKRRRERESERNVEMEEDEDEEEEEEQEDDEEEGEEEEDDVEDIEVEGDDEDDDGEDGVVGFSTSMPISPVAQLALKMQTKYN